MRIPLSCKSVHRVWLRVPNTVLSAVRVARADAFAGHRRVICRAAPRTTAFHHSMPTQLNIAIVAPSMGILGGQAVQASRLLRSWRDDPDVHAWLVPINPVPPGPFKSAARVKYLRTVAT